VQRLWYANAEFLTDDRVADALMAYASVLAIVESADVVRIPGVDSVGKVRSFQLILGPASQILAVDTDEASVLMDVDGAVDELRRRSDLRLPSTSDVLRSSRKAPMGTQ
jgi:hypothetical protein